MVVMKLDELDVPILKPNASGIVCPGSWCTSHCGKFTVIVPAMKTVALKRGFDRLAMPGLALPFFSFLRPKRGCWLINFLATFPVRFPNVLSPPRLDGLNEGPASLDCFEEWLGLLCWLD
jgi:hypothetical protein